MALKLYDKKDDVPAEVRDAAIETKDGKFAIAEAEDTSSYTKALDEERTKREAAEKGAKKAADELKKLETKSKAANAGLTEDQLQQLRSDARKEVEDEYKDRLADFEKTKLDNRTLKLDNRVKKMFADANFKASKLDDLWSLHGKEFDLTDDDAPMIKGKPGVDPVKHIEALKKLRSEWVEGTKAAGGGAAGVNGNGAVETGKVSFEDLSKNPGHALAMARAGGAKE